MFIAYKDEDKEQYISQSGLNPENLPALKIKTSKGDKFAFLKASGENLSKVKANIGDKNYYLQKMNPVCISISYEKTYNFFSYVNGKLETTNIVLNTEAEKNQRLFLVQYIPEYGLYLAFLYTESDVSGGGWSWLHFDLGSVSVSRFIGYSEDGVNFYFSSNAITSKPLYTFYDKIRKRIEVGFKYISGARTAVDTIDPCYIAEYNISENKLEKTNTGEFTSSTGLAFSSDIRNKNCIIVKTTLGNIYCLDNAHGHLSLHNDWCIKVDESTGAGVYDYLNEMYYNENLQKIYVKLADKYYYINDSEKLDNTLVNCDETEFYKSYGNINGYEIFSKNQIYKDFNNKIDLGVSLYSLAPVSMSYDFYTNKYILLCSDNDNFYIKATSDFNDYETLYSTSIKGIVYCSISGFAESYRTEL